ncbi:uncharacterized protein UTRI_10287 [Ustilago trichophora]|uniref:Uncharacterized protein n=1 Tax=Ustilago trichophora TaxID=86804 RepID=A0A5C3EGR1_9BASI|nr:uncharacterized protein UTRI_10287 [Ustilago trichophora]
MNLIPKANKAACSSCDAEGTSCAGEEDQTEAPDCADEACGAIKVGGTIETSGAIEAGAEGPGSVDPFNVWRRELAATATSSRDATSDIGNVDNDAASNKATTDNKKSYNPKTSRLMTNFFFSLKDSDGQWVTFHLCEIKAYHVGNLWKLQEFFTHHQEDSSPTPSGGHQWRTINVPELARDKMLDCQALASVSQCTSYIPAHGVSFKVLTTGLANVFFWIH